MVITGWKSISTTLGVSVATAKEWRTKHALPVVNLSSRCVATTRAHLAEWEANRQLTASQRVADAIAAGVREGS